ncbi:MAG: phenylalanine--tRNA ligase subunit alpha [candidate division FCPU426 bacterium]
MLDKIKDIEAAAIAALPEAGQDLKKLGDWQVRFLGKKGELTLLLRETGKLPEAERPAFGVAVNQAKAVLVSKAEEIQAGLEKKLLEEQIKSQALDVTLPGRRGLSGSIHPLSGVMRDCADIFNRLGFNVETGPEIEDVFHNFDALNVGEGHPSREPSDTYYLDAQRILRTHTSPVQVRAMESRKPPIRMIALGRVFRRDASDATHGSQFHQIEGLAVDEFGKVRLSDLKGTLETFVKMMFGRELKSRFRPSFFPFTEPSVELDMQCFQCKGLNGGCGVCKMCGWIELGGAGMVHPNVFKALGYEEGRYAGFAFGFGVDRLAMMRHGIPDLRLFWENDAEFLKQF